MRPEGRAWGPEGLSRYYMVPEKGFAQKLFLILYFLCADVQHSGESRLQMVLSGGRPSDILRSVADSQQIQKVLDTLSGGLGVGSQFSDRQVAVVEVGVEPFCRTEA